MKSVSNLNRVWGAQSHAISDAETTITRYDLRTGMLSQPTRQGRRFIVGQHVDRAAYCQVHQEQSIAQWSSVQREVVHSQLRRRLTHGELLVAQQTAQGIWTGWQTRSSRDSGSSFTASPLGEREQEASRLFRPTAVVRQESRESLRKDLPRASGFDDLVAITNAFRYPWSTGPVEGHITRVKLIKRAGCGRAKLPLLRARILGPN